MERNTHEKTLLRLSGRRGYLEEHAEAFDNRFVYGDPVYGVSKSVVSPFKGANLPAEQQLFNWLMISVREPVKWSLGRMKTLSAAVDFKKPHKVMLSPVSKVVQWPCC